MVREDPDMTELMRDNGSCFVVGQGRQEAVLERQRKGLVLDAFDRHDQGVLRDDRHDDGIWNREACSEIIYEKLNAARPGYGVECDCSRRRRLAAWGGCRLGRGNPGFP